VLTAACCPAAAAAAAAALLLLLLLLLRFDTLRGPQVMKNKIRGVNMKGFGYGGEDAYFYASRQCVCVCVWQCSAALWSCWWGSTS
jgi:hypothetical protein